MNAAKQNRMMSVYNGFRGDATVNDILSRIPAELKDVLTGAQLGHVMNAINQAYHDGKAAAGAWCESGLVGFGNTALPKAVVEKLHVKNEQTQRFVKGRSPAANRHYEKRGEDYVEISNTEASVKATSYDKPRDIYYQTTDDVTVVSYDGKEIARHPGIL